ncbi:MAG: flagellar brake domain-containing protein [Deltaproteobacteria bacterium]|nr:flagellar brake domain-containing protein [Deltaproteobacteria bacterium]
MSQPAHTAAPHPDIPITVGTELLLELLDLKLKMRGELVGGEHRRYLIVKLPGEDLGFGVESLKGSRMIIRYLFKGSIYGFKSEVVNTLASPSRLAFVAYPEKVEEFKVRNTPRYECILPGSAELGSEAIEIVVIDISLKGCRAIINTGELRDREKALGALDVGKELVVSVQLPGAEERLHFHCEVKNHSRDSERVVVGLLFNESDNRSEGRLSSFLNLISAVKPRE